MDFLKYQKRLLLLLSLLPMASFSSDCLVRNGVWLSASSEVLRKYSVGACRNDVYFESGESRESKYLELFDSEPERTELTGYSDLTRWENGITIYEEAAIDYPGIRIGDNTNEAFHSRASLFSEQINTIASEFNIDPGLLHSIAYVESRYNPSAVSPAGAKGMMQIMPATARRLGLQGSEEQLFNPLVSLHLSSTYLRILYDLFGNDLELVLAAYNAGENAVIKYGYTIPPYRETQNYVKSVMNYYLNIKA